MTCFISPNGYTSNVTFVLSTEMLEKARHLYRKTQKEITFTYSHKNYVKHKTWFFNCYGLINHIHTNKLKPIQDFMKSCFNPIGPNKDGTDKPCPLHYIAFHDALVQKKIPKKNCLPIVSFFNLKPGHLIAYKAVRKKNNKPCRGQHIMMVETVHPLQKTMHIDTFDLPITILHTTKYPTSASFGKGFYRETKLFKLNREGYPTHIRWSPEGKYLKRRIIALAPAKEIPLFTSIERPLTFKLNTLKLVYYITWQKLPPKQVDLMVYFIFIRFFKMEPYTYVPVWLSRCSQ